MTASSDPAARSDPAADSGDRIGVVYRYRESTAGVFVIWIIAGP